MTVPESTPATGRCPTCQRDGVVICSLCDECYDCCMTEHPEEAPPTPAAGPAFEALVRHYGFCVEDDDMTDVDEVNALAAVLNAHAALRAEVETYRLGCESERGIANAATRRAEAAEAERDRIAAETVERCMAALCWGCRNGSESREIEGKFYHFRQMRTGSGDPYVCEASALRALLPIAPTRGGEA